MPRLAERGFGLAAIALAAAATFLVAGQLASDEPIAPALSGESEEDLARILAGLNAEADALQVELADLKVQLSELRRSTQSEEAAAAAADQQLRTLQVLSGSVPVAGPGVVVLVDDPDRELGYDALIDVIQELRDAGAEALAVNGHRIGVATAFAERGADTTVDGAPLTPPYRIEAIGPSATLEGGLAIPGGAVDTISAVRGAAVEVRRQSRLELPALPPRRR